MTGVLIRKTDTYGESHETMKAQTGVMQQQAKEYQKLPANHQKEAGRGKIPCSFQKGHGPANISVWDF